MRQPLAAHVQGPSLESAVWFSLSLLQQDEKWEWVRLLMSGDQDKTLSKEVPSFLEPGPLNNPVPLGSEEKTNLRRGWLRGRGRVLQVSSTWNNTIFTIEEGLASMQSTWTSFITLSLHQDPMELGSFHLAQRNYATCLRSHSTPE